MSNIPALMDLLFGGARQRVLAVLLLQPESGFHLRELARLSGTHAGTLARELEKLVQAGLLSRSEHGNQVRYQADRTCPLFEELASMFRKTHGAVAVVREALDPLARRIRWAAIFGSVARGAAARGSDVDVLVVGEVRFSEVVRALHPAQQALAREINPVVHSPAEFRSRAHQAFVREVLAHPVLDVIGARDDLAEPDGDPSPAGVRR